MASRHNHTLVRLPRRDRYKCSGCKEEGGNGGFGCRSCADFKLHEKCAELPDEYQSIHFHEKLDFRSQTKSLHRNCRACKNTIGGFLFKIPRRRRSSLLHPSLRFHPLCITLPESFTCSKHRNHSLKLVKVEDGDYTCGFCNKRSQGWRYTCQRCIFILDLTCAKLDLQGLLEHPSQGQAIPQEGNRRHAVRDVLVKVAATVGVSAFVEYISDVIQ